MTKLIHTFKTDILFKTLFEKHPKLLKNLVSQLLGISLASITKFEIRNQEIPPDFLSNKFCRLDIHMEIDGRQVNLEVQVENEGDFPERALFHWARIYSSSLSSGEKYSQLPQTIVISIVDFTLFDEDSEFHSEFRPLEVIRKFPLSDKMVLHFFELTKLPEKYDKNSLLQLWLALFRANTEEELSEIESLGVSEMNEAIEAYNSIKASRDFQDLERRRVMASHDEAQALYNATKRGEAKGELKGRAEASTAIVFNALDMKMSISDIVKLTGLEQAEIEKLKEEYDSNRA